MKITINVRLRRTQVAMGLLCAAFAVAITDNTGTAHSKIIKASDFGSLGQADGDDLIVPVVFEDTDGVPAGPFTGSVQTIDQNGANLGDPVPFTSPDNSQFVAVSVDVKVG